MIKKAKKNPELIHELIEKKEEEKRKREEIGEYIFDLNEINHYIDSAETIQKKLKEDKNMEVKQRYIATIMK